MLVAKVRRSNTPNTLQILFSRNPLLNSQFRSLQIEQGKKEVISSLSLTPPFDILDRVMGIKGAPDVRSRIFNSRHRGTYLYRPSEEYNIFRSSLKEKKCYSK